MLRIKPKQGFNPCRGKMATYHPMMASQKGEKNEKLKASKNLLNRNCNHTNLYHLYVVNVDAHHKGFTGNPDCLFCIYFSSNLFNSLLTN